MTDLYAQIQSAANAGAFGLNGYALPTAANCKAGNYRKGRVKLYGFDIAIETPQGQCRMGKSDGKPWSVTCMAHYGDISGTRGADGDPVDCYIGPTPESNRVFVVNQNGKSGSFDEHKVMLAFADEDAARSAYLGSYERGWTGLGSMVAATVSQFRWWLKFGDTRKPFTNNALPYDGDDDMTEITWDSAAMPANSDLATILYGLRLGDRDEGLLLDAVQMSDIMEDADSLEVFDALVVENAKLKLKMEQLQRIMEAAGDKVKPVALQISEPFKQKGTTNVTALFELSDGQTVAIFFHNPDSTPNKLLPQDELVSWKWLLNKKDVTILVAPEKGRDLNPREVARRVIRLAERNSAKFQKANGARSERLAGIEQSKQDVAAKESALASLDAEIAELTVKVEAKRANQAPMPGGEQGAGATAVQPNVLSQPFSEWLDAEWSTNRYRAAYLEDHGDELKAKYAAASGGGDTESAARMQYQKELFDQPRDATIELRVYDQYDGQPEIQRALTRHFFDLESRLSARSTDNLLGKKNSPEEAAKQARIAEITAEISAINAMTNRTASGTKADQDRQKRLTRLQDELVQLQRLALGEYPGYKAEQPPGAAGLAEVARRLIPAEFETRDDADGFTAIAADGYGIRLRPTAGGKMLGAYILKPGVDAQESMGSSTLENGTETAVRTAVYTALMFIQKWRAERVIDLSSASLIEGPELSALGMANIVSLGGKNVYIEKDGKVYYTEDLEPDNHQLGMFDFLTIAPSVLFAPDEIASASDRLLKQRRMSLGAYLEAANAAKAMVGDPILDEYQAIVSEEGRRSRGEADPVAAEFPADIEASVGEIAQNYALTTIEFNGAPITRELIVKTVREAFAEHGEEAGREKVRVTLESSRAKALDALYSKAYGLYRDRVNGAPLAGNPQLKVFVASGALDVSDQPWAADYYRLSKIDPGKIGKINTDGLSPEAAANLARFAGGDFSHSGDNTSAGAQAYVDAAKAFIEGDLKAPVPKGKSAEMLDIEFLGGLQPKPLDKAIKQAKTPQDQFKAAYDTAGDGDPRYYLNGVHTDPENKIIVSTDGHRMMVVSDVDLSHLPAKEVDSYTVLGRDGKWIEGRFPDWRRVMPTDIPASALGKFTAKRVAAHARAVVKAYRYVSKKHHGAVKVQVGERYAFLSANYLMDLAVAFQKYGYNTFKMGMQSGAVGKQSLYAESADGKVRQVVMPLRVDTDLPLFAMLLPDGLELPQDQGSASVENDPNIGRSWVGEKGEVKVEYSKGSRYYTLLNGRSMGAPVIEHSELDSYIALDEQRYRDRQEMDAHNVALEERLAAEKAAHEAEYADIGEVEGETPMQRGRRVTALSALIRHDGAVKTKKKMIEDLVAAGAEAGSYEENRLKDMSRTAFNRATQREQDDHARKVKAGGTVTVYTLGDSVIDKTAYDYARYLISLRAAGEPDTTQGDDQMQAARDLLQSVIDGSADMDEALADRLQAIHDQYESNAEIMELFEQAANAFSDAMIAKARAALAA